MTANYIYTESIETAWDALTAEQTAELEKAWDEINASDMTALEAVIDYISEVGLEGIGMETTEENIKKLNADDFRDIIVG